MNWLFKVHLKSVYQYINIVFNILILNELTDFVLVQIVSTVYEIYPQNRHLVLFCSGFDSRCPLIANYVSFTLHLK